MATVPSPIITGRQQRQPFLEQLLISLLSQTPNLLLGQLNRNQTANAPAKPSFAQEVEGEFALNELIQGATPEESPIKRSLIMTPGLGDARVSMGKTFKQAERTAPLELEKITKQRQVAAVEAEKARILGEIKTQAGAIAAGISGITPDQRAQVSRIIEFKSQFPEALPAESYTALLNQILPPDAVEQSLILEREQTITESKARVGKIALEIKLGKDRQTAVAALAQELGVDWYAPGLEDEAMKFITESQENPAVARQRFALSTAGIVRMDFEGNPIAFVTGTEAVQLADKMARDLDPAGGASLPPLDPAIVREVEFVGVERPEIQASIREKIDLGTIRNTFTERALAFGIPRERIAQLFVEIMRTIPPPF